MDNMERIAFTSGNGAYGDSSLLPLLPIVLTYQGRSTRASGLLDTGATINVLPYQFGVALGAVWEQQTPVMHLTGNLARFEARPLIVSVAVSQFASVRLVFAWTQAEHVPLILGQVYFFMEFDVCFYRSQQAFEIRPKS